MPKLSMHSKICKQHRIYQWIREALEDGISFVVNHKEQFRTKPSCFTRKRFYTVEKFLTTLCKLTNLPLASSIFNAQVPEDKANCPSISSFIQYRKKFSLEAFRVFFQKTLYSIFKKVKRKLYRKRYTVCAIDGSDFSTPTDLMKEKELLEGAENNTDISRLKEDKEEADAMKRAQRTVQNRKLHVNALFDVLNLLYLAVEMHPKLRCNEAATLVSILQNMLEVNKDLVPSNMILLADRGYEGYGVLAWLALTGFRFVFRVKSPSSNGILRNKSYGLQPGRIIDQTITFYVTQNADGTFEKADCEIKGVTKAITIRVISKRLKDGSYAYWLTNLMGASTPGADEQETFTRKDVYNLYKKRWEIETSFRFLKYGFGAICFHSKSMEHQKMEIYAAMTMMNCVMTIVTRTPVKDNPNNGHKYKINCTVAVSFCMEYLFCKTLTEKALERLLQRNKVEIISGRHFPRAKTHKDKTRYFCYRPR